MANSSPIKWTDPTWNPVAGCSKISPGCKFCYAERLARRLQAMGQKNYRSGFEVTLQPHMLEHPLRWRQPRRMFVNSISDLFHPAVPADYAIRTRARVPFFFKQWGGVFKKRMGRVLGHRTRDEMPVGVESPPSVR